MAARSASRCEAAEPAGGAQLSRAAGASTAARRRIRPERPPAGTRARRQGRADGRRAGSGRLAPRALPASPSPAASRAARPAPLPPAAPSGWRLTRPRTAGRSAPARLPAGGGEDGGAGRVPARFPPPGPQGGWAEDAGGRAPSLGPAGSPARLPGPALSRPGLWPPAPPGGSARARLLSAGLLLSPPGPCTREGRRETCTVEAGGSQTLFISVAVFTRHFYPQAHAAAPGLCPVRKCKSTPSPSCCTQRDQSCACVQACRCRRDRSSQARRPVTTEAAPKTEPGRWVYASVLVTRSKAASWLFIYSGNADCSC